MMYGKLSMLS